MIVALRPLTVLCAIAILIAGGNLRAEPISPNIVAVDFNFLYSTVTYDNSTQRLYGYASTAVATFEPVLGGTTYPVFDVTGAQPGGEFGFFAAFDHLGTEFDVHGHFLSKMSLDEFVVYGTIPGLGIEGMTGTLVAGYFIDLEMYGDAGTGGFALNGWLLAMTGDLITAGYLEQEDVIAMRSWLSSVSPSLPVGFDFTSDFTATTHQGELGTVPEPATCVLVLLGAGLLGLARRRRP